VLLAARWKEVDAGMAGQVAVAVVGGLVVLVRLASHLYEWWDFAKTASHAGGGQ
jgi:hypothetical protein